MQVVVGKNAPQPGQAAPLSKVSNVARQALPCLLVVQCSEQGAGIGFARGQLSFYFGKQLVSGQGPASIRIQGLDKS